MNIMPIHGSFERSASFSLFGFEYAKTSERSGESWIKMEFHITDAEQEWHIIDASLMVCEVEQLAAWLRAIGENNFAVKELHFIEPNLSFCLNYNYGKTKIIKITFAAELRPAWFKESGNYVMDAHMGNRQMKMIADSLTEQLDELYMKVGVIANEVKQSPNHNLRIASSLHSSQ